MGHTLRTAIAALCVGRALGSGCTARNVAPVAKFSNLAIVLPSSLPGINTAKVEHNDAMFGRPRFSSSITEKVLVPNNSTLCDGDTPAALTAGNAWPSNPLFWPVQGSYFVMVERGACHFTEKARNAQRLGAVGLLIGNNKCRCGANGCVDADCSISLPESFRTSTMNE